MLKMVLAMVGVILICSLIATGASRFMTVQKTIEVTKANYNHQGVLKYTAYSTSGFYSGQSAPVYPVLYTKIMEDLKILFTYSGPQTQPVKIEVTLEDVNSNWQKEIPVKTTGGAVISFPLNLNDLFTVGNTINEELGTRNTSYLIHIKAEIETGSGTFKAALEGKLNTSTLTWDEAGFNKIERGFPGGDDWRQAVFGYEVKLKDNGLFGPITLRREPDLKTPFTVDPSFTLLPNLVEAIDIGFNYQFSCNAQINSLKEEANVVMVIGESDKWQKSFTLVEPTIYQAGIAIKIPLDIGKLLEMADSMDELAVSPGVKEQQITITAQVHTVAETSAGTIDEIYSQQLKGNIGSLITWETGESGSNELSLAKNGKITETNTVPNVFAQKLRTYSLIVFGGSLLAFCVLAIIYWRKRPELSVLEQELKTNRKKFGDLISEVSVYPIIRPGEVIISVSSLEALANISSNSLKAILLKIEPDKHTYCVLDGLVRYEYISQREVPIKDK
jgi:hypothetical protein